MEAQIETPLFECECDWAFRIRAWTLSAKLKNINRKLPIIMDLILKL
jgi:hypothetical protein